jgi:Mu transposase, C-terminal domain
MRCVACESEASPALVRYRNNDYSVSTAYGHREVLIKGYVHEVVICAGSEVIARHARSYERSATTWSPAIYRSTRGPRSLALSG